MKICFYVVQPCDAKHLFTRTHSLYGLPTVATDRGFPDGGSDLPILMDDVICIGNESRLIDCMHKSENGSNCVHSEDVGLVCGGGFAQEE